MFCSKCGQQLENSAIFCSRCGNKTNTSANRCIPKPPFKPDIQSKDELVQEIKLNYELRFSHVTSIVGAIVAIIAILWYFLLGVYMGILISILSILIAFTPIAVLNNSIKEYEREKILTAQQINTYFENGTYRKHIRKKIFAQYKGYRAAPFVAGLALIQSIVFLILLM